MLRCRERSSEKASVVDRMDQCALRWFRHVEKTEGERLTESMNWM